MAKALILTVTFLLLLTTACTASGPTAETAQSPTPQPEAAIPRDDQPEHRQAANPTETEVPPPRETPIPAPELTLTAGPVPATTAAQTPAPAVTAEPTTAPTQAPAVGATERPGTTWRGVTVAPEARCSPYDASDYPYPASVEPKIVEAQGGIYGPYTGKWYESIKETDIEHIVARSEAHDSGLCAASAATKANFAIDLLNLTLASPSVNRHQKSGKDLAEWLPDLNRCWYVNRTLEVRQAYDLTIDRDEADAADKILNGCRSTKMVILAPAEPVTPETSTPVPDTDALAMYDDNHNGRITCSEARAHGIAPVRRGHPAYEFMNDRDGDGVVCE